MRLLFFYSLMAIAANSWSATRDDWKVFPMTDLKVQIPLDLMYTKQEFASILQGFIPTDMDDRWVIVVEDGHIFIYRSWTGTMIYDCLFEEKGDEIWVSSMYANRNSYEYLNTDNENDTQNIKYLLDWLSSRNSQ